jgi:hypothetical protein
MDYSIILSPGFFLRNIELIGQIISVMILIVFDDFFTRKIAFGWTDALKKVMLEKAKEKFKKRYRIIIRYTFEFLATILFLAYFFAGYWVLSEYVIIPILERTQAVLSIIILVFFLTMSWMLNNSKARRKYLGYK